MINRSTVPFFGRSYILTVIPATQPDNPIVVSSDEWEPEALRFTFEIEQVCYSPGAAYWYAEIAIYNCDGEIEYGPSQGKTLVADLLTEGSRVIVQAGYQADGQPIVIWDGVTYQAIWTREDVVDFKLRIRSVLTRGNQNMINMAIPALTTPAEQARRIARNSRTPIQIDDSHLQLLTGPPLVRGKVVFGNPYRYLSAMATDSQLASWATSNTFVMAQLADTGQKVLAYAPATLLDRAPDKDANGVTRSIIGTPAQTQDGITFRVLLDPRLQIQSPLPIVSVDMKYLRQAALTPPPNPQGAFVKPLPESQRYFLAGVRHVGDTRGNDWYSECTCISLWTDLLAFTGRRTGTVLGGSH